MPHSRKESNSSLMNRGQLRPAAGFGVGDEAARVLPHQAGTRLTLRAVALVVDRGVVRRPPGLSTDGLHNALPRG